MRKAMVVGMFALALAASGFAQQQQGPGGPPAGQPPREGRGPGGPGGMAPELREKFEQLRNVSQKLQQQEFAVLQTDAELQAMRDDIRDSFEKLIGKVRTFDQKLDDLVVKASPEAEPLVKEKRQIIADLEQQAGPRKSMLWMQGLMRLVGVPGPGPAGPGRPGAGPGGPPRRDAAPGGTPQAPTQQQ